MLPTISRAREPALPIAKAPPSVPVDAKPAGSAGEGVTRGGVGDTAAAATLRKWDVPTVSATALLAVTAKSAVLPPLPLGVPDSTPALLNDSPAGSVVAENVGAG